MIQVIFLNFNICRIFKDNIVVNPFLEQRFKKKKEVVKLSISFNLCSTSKTVATTPMATFFTEHIMKKKLINLRYNLFEFVVNQFVCK